MSRTGGEARSGTIRGQGWWGVGDHVARPLVRPEPVLPLGGKTSVTSVTTTTGPGRPSGYGASRMSDSRLGGPTALGAPRAREMARAPARTAGPTRRAALSPAGMHPEIADLTSSY